MGCDMLTQERAGVEYGNHVISPFYTSDNMKSVMVTVLEGHCHIVMHYAILQGFYNFWISLLQPMTCGFNVVYSAPCMTPAVMRGMRKHFANKYFCTA